MIFVTSTQLCPFESSHRENEIKLSWLCSNKALITKIGGQQVLAHSLLTPDKGEGDTCNFSEDCPLPRPHRFWNPPEGGHSSLSTWHPPGLLPLGQWQVKVTWPCTHQCIAWSQDLFHLLSKHINEVLPDSPRTLTLSWPNIPTENC